MKTLPLFLMFACALSAADVSGKWIFTVETSAGSGSPTFVLKQDGESLTGDYSGALGQAKVRGSVKGDQILIEFDVEGQGQSAAIQYKGVVESNTRMKGAVKLGTFGEGTWTAQKQ
jgi:hypothetical protein